MCDAIYLRAIFLRVPCCHKMLTNIVEKIDCWAGAMITRIMGPASGKPPSAEPGPFGDEDEFYTPPTSPRCMESIH